MNDMLTLFSYIAIGAALMFLLDPDRGRGRRAFVRDKTVRFWRKSVGSINERSHDLGNRVHGMVTERRLKRKVERADDVVIVERVRSKMGHKVAHSRSIEVNSTNGVVTLGGRAPEPEILTALAVANHVIGVIRVRDRIRSLPAEATLLRVEKPVRPAR